MSTKDRILHKALVLFNELGSDDVSLRAIARELEISVGNLAYHFANTDKIIEALYYQLVEEMDKPIQEIEEQEAEFSLMLRLSRKNFEIMFRYRFILLDFTRITRRIPGIQQHFISLIEARKHQFRYLLDQLVRRGVLQQEPFQEAYAKMIERLLVIGDYWIPHAHIHFPGKGEEAIDHYHQLMISEIEPFLTQEGRTILTDLQIQ